VCSFLLMVCIFWKCEVVVWCVALVCGYLVVFFTGGLTRV
jgi:hypothetical protein